LLSATSPCIDSGAVRVKGFSASFTGFDTLIQFPDTIVITEFNGTAPDIGAQEYGATTKIQPPLRGAPLAQQVRIVREAAKIHLIVSLQPYSTPSDLRIIDPSGRMVYHWRPTATGVQEITLDIPALARGVYLLTMGRGHAVRFAVL
jgi:hypothetical protein